FGPYEAYYNAGNYQEVINLTSTTLSGADNLEESHFWRGRAYAALGQTDAARQDFQKAIRLNSNFSAAQEALAALP
ncbi:MAG: tetratricopeptide repeat protein, partial [Ardenticatenaceae bacterium]